MSIVDGTHVSIGVQVTEARREATKRREVYARLVSAGKMKQSQADYQIAIMEAIVRTLERVERGGQ